MKIVGIEGMTAQDLRDEVSRGGKFVIYGWCVSFLVVTLRRSSDVTFVRADSSPAVAGLGWTALSFFLGWWGFPWGLIYTPMVIIQNLSGGKDVTREVMLSLGTELGGASFASVPSTPTQTTGLPPSTLPPQAPPAPAPTMVGAGAPPPPAASGTDSREVIGLVLSLFAFCCAPIGWIGAVLAILSIRDAKAKGLRTPVLSIITLVIVGLSTLVLIASIGVGVAENSKWGRKVDEAKKEAAEGRVRTELDARTACALAKATLWDGAYDFHRDWDSIDCVPPLTNDPVTPALDVTAKRSTRTEHLTVCFARSNVRWFALSVRSSTVCPDASALTVPAGTGDDELDRLEREHRRLADDAPDKTFKPTTPDLVAEPALGEADAFFTFPLTITGVVEHQKPTTTKPFHAPGGEWTFFDIAPLTDPTCTVRLGVFDPPPSKEPFVFSDVMLVPLDRASGACFLDAFRLAIEEPAPKAGKTRKLVPVKLGAAVLGKNMSRNGSGGFSSGRGNWTTTKLFFEQDDRYAEVFFNFDLKTRVAELSEKDSEYRGDLLSLLERAVVSGW